MKMDRKHRWGLIFLLASFLVLNSLTLIPLKTSAHYPNVFICSAPLISHNITIDGVVTGNEWNHVTAQLVTFDFLDDVIVGYIYFTWDTNFLYLFAKILDGNISGERAFFIFFDEAHNGILDNFEDVRGLFSNNTKVNKHVNETGYLELDANEANFHAAYYISTGFRRFEMAIPFSSADENLNINPKIGGIVGINLEYWNGIYYDDFPDNGRRKIVWSDQKRYGDLQFSEPSIDYDFGPLITNLIIASVIIVIIFGIIISLRLVSKRLRKRAIPTQNDSSVLKKAEYFKKN